MIYSSPSAGMCGKIFGIRRWRFIRIEYIKFRMVVYSPNVFACPHCVHRILYTRKRRRAPVVNYIINGKLYTSVRFVSENIYANRWMIYLYVYIIYILWRTTIVYSPTGKAHSRPYAHPSVINSSISLYL